METVVQAALQYNNFTERRRESRERISRRVTISDLAQLQLHFSGQIVDSSHSGMKLALNKPLHAASSLAVEWDDTCVLADVAYCIRERGRYFVGLKTNYVIQDRTRFHRARQTTHLHKPRTCKRQARSTTKLQAEGRC